MTLEEGRLVQGWLSRAREVLAEAAVLIDTDHATGAVNRIYYACFYAVTALLLSEGQSSSRHSGVKMLFHRDWVKTGRVPSKMGTLYQLLFDRRMAGDYTLPVSYSREEVTGWLAQAREFVAMIATLLPVEE